MSVALVVVHAFNPHEVGDLIMDYEERHEILGGEHRHKVIGIDVPRVITESLVES